MRVLTAVAMALLMVPGTAMASEAGDRLAQRLYDGTLERSQAATLKLCEESNADACFAAGLTELIGGVETLTQAFYRHGATVPGMGPAALMLGIGEGGAPVPANPNPEPLSYEQLRVMLHEFVTTLDVAREHFEIAGAAGDYVLLIDPLQVRLDLNGDGKRDAGETLGALIGPLGELAHMPVAPAPGHKIKNKAGAPTATTIGFDRADALWFAGYTQITAAPIDLLLAHDFSAFFNAYLHRVFPKAGLPMQPYSVGGSLFMDAESDAGIADIIAAIHTIDFPVADSTRLAGVLTRLHRITDLSRRNWEAILLETDDNRELIPSPRQTALMPDMAITQDSVDAWMATLTTIDDILAGKLLLPHWRFKQGFDLKAYFETATETDLVMLFTGYGAFPFIKDGPVADAESFAELNRVFGDDWPIFALWFN